MAQWLLNPKSSWGFCSAWERNTKFQFYHSLHVSHKNSKVLWPTVSGFRFAYETLFSRSLITTFTVSSSPSTLIITLTLTLTLTILEPCFSSSFVAHTTSAWIPVSCLSAWMLSRHRLSHETTPLLHLSPHCIPYTEFYNNTCNTWFLNLFLLDEEEAIFFLERLR